MKEHESWEHFSGSYVVRLLMRRVCKVVECQPESWETSV